MGLLPPDAWDRQHALAFALRLELAETEYLTGRLEDAERAYEVLLERAATPLESSDAYLLMMNQYETTARYYDAIRAGMAALGLLGFALPETEAEQRGASAPRWPTVRWPCCSTCPGSKVPPSARPSSCS